MKRAALPWIVLFAALLLLTGCETSKNDHTIHSYDNEAEPTKEIYVDFKRWQEGRLCSDIAFRCLPENRDPSWQEIPTKDNIEDLDLTPEVEERYKEAIEAWNRTYNEYIKKHPDAKGDVRMKISSLDRDFFEKVDERRFLERMEKSLEEEFPGFWRDTPKKVRYRWIRRAMNKAKRLGYYIQGNLHSTEEVIELCARIGLDFDKDPKWKEITAFIKQPKGPTLSYALMACDYIDFTIFNKNINMDGHPINDWSLREALQYLPYPKRPIPRLNDY